MEENSEMNVMSVVCVILKNIIYGSSVFFTGELTDSVDVFDILALRFLMSFVTLWILKTTRIIKIEIQVRDFFVKNERSPYVKSLLLGAVFEPVLYMIFETFGISMTTGITAGVILALSPIISCITEFFVLKEKSGIAHIIFIAIGIAGIVYITVNTNTSTGENTVWGILCVFLAVVSGTFFTAFSRKSSKHFAPLEISYTSCILGTAVFNAINIARHLYMGNISSYFLPYFNIDNLIGFIFISIISSIAATGMGNYALKKMQISTAAAFGGISTLVTVGIGVLVAGETLYTYHIIGLIMIFVNIIGVTCLARKKASAKLN